jgi:hypothetical protein
MYNIQSDSERVLYSKYKFSLLIFLMALYIDGRKYKFYFDILVYTSKMYNRTKKSKNKP